MKKTRYLYIVFLLISFLLIPKVKADVGDLRYQITDVIITEDKITFKGWAFIHQTHNYVNLYEVKNKIETNKLMATGGGQKILISACDDKNNNCLEKIVDGGFESVNYNFTYSLYTNHGGDFYDEYNGGPTYRDTNELMSCKTNNAYSNCYYRDLGFNITFNLDDLLKVGDNITFKIAVTNNDFEKKCNDGYITSLKCKSINGKKYTIYSDLTVVNQNVNNILNRSGNIVEITSSYENKVKFLAETALVRKINTTKLAKGIVAFSGDFDENTTYGEIDSTFLVRAYSKESLSGTILNTVGPGKYALHYSEKKICSTGQPNYGHWCLYGSTDSNDPIMGAWSSWVIPSGQFKIKIKNDKKCDVDTGEPESLSCNNTSNILSECKELSVRDKNNNSAVISVKQTGTIANLLSPKEIYNGGGIKFGILYYNKIQFDYISGSRNINITDIMNSRIKGTEDIGLENIKIGNISVGSAYIKKKCEQIKNDNSVETICLFHFTPQLVNEDGTITKDDIDASYDLGINNKYYLPLEYQSVYRLSGDLVNASFLDKNAAAVDSKNKNIPWYGTKWDRISLSDDGTCDINTYKLGPGRTEKEGSETNSSNRIMYNFIYRPINLENPFPNREAGLNWREWYSSDINKYRLKKSYSSSDYYKIELDNITVNKIKAYNKNSDYFTFDYNEFTNIMGKKIEVGGNG